MVREKWNGVQSAKAAQLVSPTSRKGNLESIGSTKVSKVKRDPGNSDRMSSRDSNMTVVMVSRENAVDAMLVEGTRRKQWKIEKALEAKEIKTPEEPLKPKPNLTCYEKDPTFESKAEIPFISTLSHSRLVIRAVLLNDMKLLKKLIHDEPQKNYTLCMPRSIKNSENVMHYILKNENREAFDFIKRIPDGVLEKFGSPPSLMITEEGTGQGSCLMFGHAMRPVTVGRRGKEGNNALLYDVQSAYQFPSNLNLDGLELIKLALKIGVTPSFIDYLMEQLDIQTWDYHSIHLPLRKGHYELVGKGIAKANLKGGYGFNNLHEEALTKKTADTLSAFKPLSATKKCTYEPRFTPLHCAAINPNASVLTYLCQRAMPDFNQPDGDGWTVGHYAAVCCSPDPLTYLLQLGISVNDTTSARQGGDAYTLLHAAVSAGRTQNVKVILDHVMETLKGEDMSADRDDIRYKLTARGQNALHMACELGHVEIVKLLLKAGVTANRPTPPKQDRLTPLMIASMFGHLDVVKVLVESNVNVSARDKRGRTAAHHATMNGHCHVLSYLLRLGIDHLATDSSGNTLLHYSTAYGWYFATMLLLEAGCTLNTPNFWKMTPIAIAFMKGHTGLVTELIKQKGVDVNAHIDDNGRTLFLEMCNSGADLDQMKFLVEDLKADFTCEDFRGNNALHYMALKNVNETESFNECIAYLLKKGCDPFKRNAEGSSPILVAAKAGNFHLIQKLVDQGIQIPYEQDSLDNTLLHFMCSHFLQSGSSLVHSTFTRLCDDRASLNALTKMASAANKSGCTPLLQLLQQSTNTPIEDNQISRIVDTFLGRLNADVNATIKIGSPLTALHLSIGLSAAILETVLKYKPNMEPLDDQFQTPLAIAVMSRNHEAATKLIDAGANVNIKIKSDLYGTLGLILIAAIKETSSFSLIPKLLEKGADCHEIHPTSKNSLLHYIARRPNVSHAVDALKAVLEAGVKPNLVNHFGRTPLHLAINARRSETDVVYDIEQTLIASGADLKMKDNRGRIPLHYAFVKIGKPIDATFFDPSELVSQILVSMKASGAAAEIHTTDVYGSSALHYAAFRGATICSSYLIQSLKQGEIDTCDGNGNTPFGLAVRNAHEGCALSFYHQKGSFLKILNNNIKIQRITVNEEEEDGTTCTKRGPWKWSFTAQEEEEMEKLKDEKERYPILEQVVKHDWQGMLHLMIGQLQSTGVGLSVGIAAALKTQHFKLALKLCLKVKQKKELGLTTGGTLFHVLAKHYDGSVGDEDLVQKIWEVLCSHGVDPSAVDEFGSHAVIYAIANHQQKLCNILVKAPDMMKTLASLKPDSFGRTPFNALFWTMKEQSSTLQQFAEQLISAGADPNELCEYPLSLSDYPGVRCSKKLANILPTNGTKLPPLIVAVIAKSYSTVKWLLNIKSTPATIPVLVNVQDSEGRTALMHAVRLNDTKMVKLLMDPVNYEYLKDTDSKLMPEKGSCKVDVTIRDMEGYTVMDHLILCPVSNYYYKNFQQIFNLLKSMDALSVTSEDGMTPLERAIQHKRSDMAEILSQSGPLSAEKMSSLIASWQDDSDLSPTFTFAQDILLPPIQDFTTAAEKMAEKLIQRERERRLERGEIDSGKPQPDPLCGLDHNAEVMMDPHQNIPYDCFMTKVNINYGQFGLYNFYKMQLIRQSKGKSLIFLFTQWGRVGTTGQYQKTPFSTEKEATKEFEKIFYSKSGVSWEDVQNFNPQPEKYRLVKKDPRLVKYSTEAQLDFEELDRAGKCVESTLPKSILNLIRNVSLVHQDAESNYSLFRKSHINSTQAKADINSLTLLSTEALSQGEKILKEIGKKINLKQRMERNSRDKYTENDKMATMNEIVKLSEEFYSIIPVFEYSTEKLEPIFMDGDLRQKQVDISCLLHLGLAKSLLLAAQYYQASTNPYEYIYWCLGTKIQLLDREDPVDFQEADLILQYIHNTGDNVKVRGIYRVDIPSEKTRLEATNVGNRQLMWHGTSSANVLSILKEGLQVAPLSAQCAKTALLGKGVYLADMFAKSQHFCRSGEVNGKCTKYMFLCDAALGKVWETKLNDAIAQNCNMPVGYDSLKTSDSKYEPDPEATIVWKGRTIALGTKKENPFGESWGWGLDYNDYIVFNTDQIAVRYMIQFED